MEERRKQTGAGKGTRSKKSGQSIYFEGYKKHTVYALLPIRNRWHPLPLCSSVRAANTSEQKVVKALFYFVHHCLRWPMVFAIGDQGYINAQFARFLRRRWEMAQIVRPKKNMKPPNGCDGDGCPLCPWGERLIWEDYDAPSEQLIYRADRRSCAACALSGTCPKQFEYPAGSNETFWGMVPSHSRLARRLLRQFRPRIEPGFNLAKNKYCITDFFLNSRHLARTLAMLSDILETLEILAQERPARGRQTRQAILRDVLQLELWD